MNKLVKSVGKLSLFEYATIAYFLGALLFYILGFNANWKVIMNIGILILLIDIVQLSKQQKKFKEAKLKMQKKAEKKGKK